MTMDRKCLGTRTAKATIISLTSEPEHRGGRDSKMKNIFVDPEFQANCRVYSKYQRRLKINLGVTEISARNFRP